MTTIKLGQQVQNFILKDQNDQDFSLEEYRGKKLLLSFHPLAFTKVCAEQMQSLEANLDAFRELNTVAVGVSIDHVPAKLAWAKELGISKTRLLSDFWPHGKLAQDLGIFREKNGFSQRANIILDENQKVIFVKTYPLSQLPDIDEILQFLKG